MKKCSNGAPAKSTTALTIGSYALTRKFRLKITSLIGQIGARAWRAYDHRILDRRDRFILWTWSVVRRWRDAQVVVQAFPSQHSRAQRVSFAVTTWVEHRQNRITNIAEFVLLFGVELACARLAHDVLPHALLTRYRAWRLRRIARRVFKDDWLKETGSENRTPLERENTETPAKKVTTSTPFPKLASTYLESASFAENLCPRRRRLLFRGLLFHGPGSQEQINFRVGPSKCGCYDVLWQDSDWSEADYHALAWLPRKTTTGNNLWKRLLAGYWAAEKEIGSCEHGPNFNDISSDPKGSLSPEDVWAIVDSIWPSRR